MTLLYLLAVIVTGAGWLIARRSGRPFPSLAPIFIGLVLSYVVAMLALCIDPYYEDNGLPEFIDWQDRWMWAAAFAGWVALVAVPIVFAVGAVIRRRPSKN